MATEGGDITIDVSGEMDTQNIKNESSSKFPNILTSLGPTSIASWLMSRRNSIRPWFLFLQSNSFKAPASLPRLSKRLVRNVEYFQSNYLIICLGLVLYCLITSPLLLIAIVGSFYVGYRLAKRHEEKKITFFGRELTIVQLYSLVLLASLPVFYLAGAGAVMFWVLGASFFVITLHAAFYDIESLDPEEDSFTLTGLVMEDV